MWLSLHQQMLCFVHQYVEDIFFGVKLYHFISIFYLIQKGLNKKISFNSLETCWPVRCENVFLRDFVHLHYLDVYQSEYRVVLFRLAIYTHVYCILSMCMYNCDLHTPLFPIHPHTTHFPQDLQFVLCLMTPVYIGIHSVYDSEFSLIW